MTARLRKLLNPLGDTFWLIPAAMVLAAVLMAKLMLKIDRSDVLPTWLSNEWLDSGGDTGAKTLLDTIESSAIGVAGTVFSITIAALSVDVLLVFLCVATLVYFVDHMASRINVDTVVDLVSDDVRTAMAELTSDKPPAALPPAAFWQNAVAITDPRSAYLQQLDADGLADWAAAHGTAIRLLARRGDFVFPGGAIDVLLH